MLSCFKIETLKYNTGSLCIDLYNFFFIIKLEIQGVTSECRGKLYSRMHYFDNETRLEERDGMGWSDLFQISTLYIGVRRC